MRVGGCTAPSYNIHAQKRPARGKHKCTIKQLSLTLHGTCTQSVAYYVSLVIPLRSQQAGMSEGHGLGARGTCGHIKAYGFSPFPCHSVLKACWADVNMPYNYIA